MKKTKTYFGYVIITLFSYFLLNIDLRAQCPSITDNQNDAGVLGKTQYTEIN